MQGLEFSQTPLPLRTEITVTINDPRASARGQIMRELRAHKPPTAAEALSNGELD